MPALPDVAKVLKIDCKHSYGGDLDALSRFYMSYTGTAPLSSDLTALCVAIGDSWNTELKALASTTVSLETVEATDLTSATSAQSSSSPAITGTRSGDPLTADSSALVGYEIERRYRGGHPRGYWPLGIASDLLTPQTWSDAFVATYAANVAAMMSAIAAAVWSGGGALDQVNVSYFNGFVAVENPLTHRYRNVPTVRATPLVDNVVAWNPRARVASQRRRLGKS